MALHDTDEIVAASFEMSIPEIFSKFGEQRFREAETESLRALPMPNRAIIVTGGGIVVRNENIEILKRLGVIVWLDSDEETLFARVSPKWNRPLLQTKKPREAFSRILGARRPLYAKIADIRVNTSILTDDEVAVAILSKLSRVKAKPGSSRECRTTAS